MSIYRIIKFSAFLDAMTMAYPACAKANNEKKYLRSLRNILTGTKPGEPGEIENLLDINDYIWAHFPECAAAGGSRPDISDLSFLKRVRMEIDPFLKLWESCLIQKFPSRYGNSVSNCVR